jgi:hypothetical protein
MPPQQFLYSPLSGPEQIRLFVLLPGLKGSEVEVEVFACATGQAPPYHALSYAWGTADFACKIKTNSGYLSVSTNLYETLKHVRFLHKKRVMWVDAICINQNDISERSNQVEIMRGIYAGAELVLAWLGPKDSTSKRAVSFLREMGEYNLKLQEDGRHRDLVVHDLDDPKMVEPQPHYPLTGYPILDDHHSLYVFFKEERNRDWESLDNFLARPWWSRAWVVQEVWSAPNVILQCGDASIAWKLVQGALKYDQAWDAIAMGLLDARSSRISKWNSLKKRYGLAIHIACGHTTGSLSSLLWNTWGREATDPRDKVYSILGLEDGTKKSNRALRVDYSKHFGDVYRETAKYVIENERSLDILLAGTGIEGSHDYPSWVPDWRQEAGESRPTLLVNRQKFLVRYTSGSLGALRVYGHGFKASGGKEAEYAFDDELTTLTVSAVVFDEVLDVTPIFEVDEDPPSWDSKFVYDFGNTGIWKEQPVEDAFLRGIDEAHSLAGKYLSVPEGKVLLTLAAGWSHRHQHSIARNVVRGRRFFVTKRGRIGISSGSTNVGDKAVIVAGCNFPLLFRQESEPRYYKLVGEAYGQLHSCPPRS